MHSLYCAVRTGSLNKAVSQQVNGYLQRFLQGQTVQGVKHSGGANKELYAVLHADSSDGSFWGVYRRL